MALRLGTSRLALLFGFTLVVALSVFAAVVLETYAIEGKLRALRRAVASLEEGRRKIDVFEARDAAARATVAAGLDRVEGEADAAIHKALTAGLAGIVVLTLASSFIIVELVAERRVERLAERDALTGLANRRLFQIAVERALVRHAREGASFALIYLDVDDFKRINDAYTHLVGDEVLQSIAARLSESIRVDDVAARLGGDEFAVLMGGVAGSEETSNAAERLAEQLAGPHRFPQLAVDVSCSFGTSSCPRDGVDFKTLLLRADERMLERKRKRRRARRLPPGRRRQDRPGGARQPPK